MTDKKKKKVARSYLTPILPNKEYNKLYKQQQRKQLQREKMGPPPVNEIA